MLAGKLPGRSRPPASAAFDRTGRHCGRSEAIQEDMGHRRATCLVAALLAMTVLAIHPDRNARQRERRVWDGSSP